MKACNNGNISIIGKHYYLIATFLSILAMYLNLRNGLLASILMVLISIILFKGLFKKHRITITNISFWILIYIIYNIITILFALLNNYPLSIIIKEIANSILPIVFYFYALRISVKEERDFESNLLVSCVIIITSGIIYNLNLNDQYYINFLNEVYPGFNMIWFTQSPRLTSWVGSVIIGVICNVGICFTFRKYVMDKKIWSFYFVIIILSLGVVLSMQRSALVVLLVNFFGLICYFRLVKKFKRKYLLVFFVVGFIVFNLFINSSCGICSCAC